MSGGGGDKMQYQQFTSILYLILPNIYIIFYTACVSLRAIVMNFFSCIRMMNRLMLKLRRLLSGCWLCQEICHPLTQFTLPQREYDCLQTL